MPRVLIRTLLNLGGGWLLEDMWYIGLVDRLPCQCVVYMFTDKATQRSCVDSQKWNINQVYSKLSYIGTGITIITHGVCRHGLTEAKQTKSWRPFVQWGRGIPWKSYTSSYGSRNALWGFPGYMFVCLFLSLDQG